jgi:hypothetical protein
MSGRPAARIGCWLVLVGATVGVFLFSSRYHEFWRDEIQQALIARAVPFGNLIPTMRTEAVPEVLFLILKLLRFLPIPYSLSALAPLGYLSLLFGTYTLLRTVSGSPARSLVVTTLLALTDTYFYELGVVVRQYGLGLGFALACVGFLGRALQSNRRSDARWGAVFGALAVSTAVHPGCVAGAALLGYACLRLSQRPTLRAVVEPLCTLPAFLFTFYLIGPYDRPPESVVEWHPTFFNSIDLAGTIFLDGVICRGWWTGWSYLDPNAIPAPKLVATASVLAALLGLVALRFDGFRRRPKTTIFYATTFVVSAMCLGYIFIFRYRSAYRHHLFMFMPALVVGLAALVTPRNEAQETRRKKLLQASVVFAMVPWFLYQYVACAKDLTGDFREPFSGTKAAAAVFPKDARIVVGGDDWMASGILFYRPDLAMRAQSSLGRPIQYWLSDWHWHERVPLNPLLNEECRRASPRPIYLIVPHEVPRDLTACTRFVSAPSSHMPDESFSIYELGCACMSGVARLE